MLHFKELGDTESVVRNAVYVCMCLTVDNFCMYLLMIYHCITFCRHECSCSSARRVSNFNTNWITTLI